MIHPLLVVGRDRICRWKRQDKLLEEIGYVVETISISGRTTADMRMHNSCCACGDQLLCTNYYPVYYFLITFLETFLPLANRICSITKPLVCALMR